MLLVQINWDKVGGFYYIPLDVQKNIFNKKGRENYIKLPKLGTNPRGVEIAKEALTALVNDTNSKKIPINWEKSDIDYDPYTRWVDLWKEG